jgi:hypothetical protein
MSKEFATRKYNAASAAADDDGDDDDDDDDDVALLHGSHNDLGFRSPLCCWDP